MEPDSEGQIDQIGGDPNLMEDPASQDGGEEHEDEDAFYENPVEMIKEFGTHPLMEKAQKALIEQLDSNRYRLLTILTDKEADLKAVTNERETLGVQLYSLQLLQDADHSLPLFRSTRWPSHFPVR